MRTLLVLVVVAVFGVAGIYAGFAAGQKLKELRRSK